MRHHRRSSFPQRSNRSIRHAACVGVFLHMAAGASPVLAGGDELVVTNSNDSGPGSLRAAIAAANANPDANTIVFAIPDPPAPILAASTFAITAPVTIDGYTQPSATPNTAGTGTNAVLQIVIDGSSTPSGSMFSITASDVVLRGLVMSDAKEMSVLYSSGSNGRIEGNFIGTDVTGTVQDGGGNHGIFTGAETTGIQIGGGQPAQRNIVSGHTAHGMRLTGDDAIVQGNLVGTDATGTQPIPNGFRGISVEGTGVVIGSDVINSPAQNVVRFNVQSGLTVSSVTSGVTILGNAVDSNGDLGIDLATGDSTLVTYNDPDDADTGANDRQNFPVLQSVLAAPSQFTVSGSLDVPAATDDASYKIRVYVSDSCDPSKHGEGSTFAGVKEVQLSGDDETFSFTINRSIALEDAITVTATEEASGNTSEFSRCYLAGSGPVFTCGDATGNDELTAPDALFVLRTAVGAGDCIPCVCDVNDSGGVTTTDALFVLRAAVGQSVELSCAACD
jgi:hypothetical protein